MKVSAIFVLIAVVSTALSVNAQTTLKKTTLLSTTPKPTTLKTTTKTTTTVKTTAKPTTTVKTTAKPTTTVKTTAKTTTNPTTLKTTTKPTTTLKITAKLTTTTTNIKLTTPVPPLSTSRLCVDTNSTASNGVIQPYYNATTGGISSCLFFIFSPSNNTAQRVQISCSTLNITSGSSLNFYEAIEMDNISECNLGDTVANSNTPVVNTVYSTTSNKMGVMSQFGSKDWFSCKWAIV